MQRRHCFLLLGLALAGQPLHAATPLAAALAHYATLAHAVYSDVAAAAQQLQHSVARFAAAPTPAGLAQAREAWLLARRRYALTEALRFYGGPIDEAGGPEPRLNAWPVDESWLDGVEGQPAGGIVNRRALALDKATLRQLHGRDGEANVATGWHAIEFLLWGQDQRADGPGDRPSSDFVNGGRANADRRRRLLELLCAMLLDDLLPLVQAWAPGQSNYRRGFERGGDASLHAVLTGLGALSRAELAGERLEVPLASRDQEDEQSCFSDSTHEDIRGNARSISVFWGGRLLRPDGQVLQGPGICEAVAVRGAEAAALAQRLSQQIDQSIAAADALQAPFDQEILGDDSAPGRQRVRHLITALLQQAGSLQELLRLLGMGRRDWRRPS